MWTTVGFDCESGTFYMHIAPARHILITDFSERWCPIGKYIYAICCCLLRFFCTGRGCFLHHASIGYAEYGVHLFKANAVSLPEDLDWSAPIVSVRCFFFLAVTLNFFDSFDRQFDCFEKLNVQWKGQFDEYFIAAKHCSNQFWE